MWVIGDLKDQLGISHRKTRTKRKERTTRNLLEATPMFQHKRSLSDISISNSGDQYEPTTIAPNVSRSPAPNYMDTPPKSQTNDLPRQEPRLSPNPNNRRDLTPSPSGRIPSYYSASDLPAPTPIPDTVYKYPTGEITTTPPSPRASVMSGRSPRRGHAPMPSTSSQFTQPPHNPLQLPETHDYSPSRRPGGPNNREVFEMHVRGPSDDQGTHHHAFGRSSTPASYATAGDGYQTADDGSYHRPVSPFGHDSRHSPHPQGWPSGDDHTTVVGSYDPGTVGSHSASPSWEGPRAL
jgi:phospholipid-translocating ATPase